VAPLRAFTLFTHQNQRLRLDGERHQGVGFQPHPFLFLPLLEGYSSQDSEGDDDEEEEETEDSDLDDFQSSHVLEHKIVVDRYGNFGWMVYQNLLQSNFCEINSGNFIEQMMQYFLYHLKQTSWASATKLQTLLECLPPIPVLKRVVSKMNFTLKEVIVVKIVLEIYENYHKAYFGPLYKVYQKELIPVLISFYNHLTNTSLEYVNNHIRKILNATKEGHMGEFLFLGTKKQYLSYYKELSRNFKNLNESNNSELYIN
jgi:hypothetical protein